MSALIVLYGSKTTLRLAPYRATVSGVLLERGASWQEDDADFNNLRLADGAALELDILERRSQTHVSFDQPYESALDLLYALADRTASFVTVNWLDDQGEFAHPRSPACALPSTGEMPDDQQAAHAAPIRVASREAFGDWLRNALLQAERTHNFPPPSPSRRPQRSLMQRLSDALFGKEM